MDPQPGNAFEVDELLRRVTGTHTHGTSSDSAPSTSVKLDSETTLFGSGFGFGWPGGDWASSNTDLDNLDNTAELMEMWTTGEHGHGHTVLSNANAALPEPPTAATLFDQTHGSALALAGNNLLSSPSFASILSQQSINPSDTINWSLDSTDTENLNRITPSQIMMQQMGLSHNDVSTQSLFLQNELNFTQHRSNSVFCDSPLFPPQINASPFAFPSAAPSLNNTPMLSATANTASSGLAATMSSVQLNPSFFSQLLVSPALGPSYAQTPTEPNPAFLFSPPMLPSSSWPQSQQPKIRNSPMINPQISSPSALGPNRTLAERSSSSSLSPLPQAANAPQQNTAKLHELVKKKSIRKRSKPNLTPEEDAKLKHNRKEAEKQRRDAIKEGLEELRTVLPQSRIPGRPPSQQLLLEIVYEYVADLQKEEKEKEATIKELESEIEAVKKALQDAE
ncbi:hypothetical protein BCR33DRAFT_719124 [Rhizoclosmatium globosum]|uniref:BHLH domain-containing protein n=1 Tax=Rhizoclosmatium globosum TaxID=329046 RepID=A0A1Y2C1Y0_9FUNG|nr:hypothetical protein BCR33DRAFT_719124 [Rhizoclosmatium globosum]|eukprot:ORY41030.1 hypothetical protein BCR33DRAFT_719124 [Rhizoclosmatium globosum]